jgi:uncharacterized membrane protein
VKQILRNNQLGLVSVILAGVLGVADLLNWHNLQNLVQSLTVPENAAVAPVILAYLVSTPVALVGAGLIVALGFWRFNRVVNLILIAAVALSAKVLPAIIALAVDGANGMPIDATTLRIFLIWDDTDLWTEADSVLRVLWLVAIVLAVVAAFGSGSKSAPVSTASPAFDPKTGEPLVQQGFAPTGAHSTRDGRPVSSMPLLALIFAFLMPIVGLILAYVSLNQVKLGQVSNSNEKQARLALTLGWVFLVLSIIFGLLALSTLRSLGLLYGWGF